jgi:hypothetical protein
MRIEFVPFSPDEWVRFYQVGGGFHGLPFHTRGGGLGSIFRNILRMLMPIAKSAVKASGKEALSTVARIASDVVAGESFPESVEKQGRAGTARLMRRAADKVEGGRLKRIYKQRKTNKKRVVKTIHKSTLIGGRLGNRKRDIFDKA